jgi:hypothetical protein
MDQEIESEKKFDEFSDIPEFKQYDGKFPVLSPEYKDTICKIIVNIDIVHFEKLKTLMKLNEYTARTSRLANVVATQLPSNYNAW